MLVLGIGRCFEQYYAGCSIGYSGFEPCACALQVVLEQQAASAGFKSEVAKAQDMHHGAINRESERLVNNLAELRSELR